METYQITLMPYHIKTTNRRLNKPTIEEVDTFMVSRVNPNDPTSPKQYESILSDIYDYGTIYGDHSNLPHKIQYIPGGFITFRLSNQVTYLKNGSEHTELLTKDQILDEILSISLEDGSWEGETFVYKVNGKEAGVFDFRRTNCIRISKVE